MIRVAGLVERCRFRGVGGGASQITPVPGGVGPMTRVMLLEKHADRRPRTEPIARPQSAGPTVCRPDELGLNASGLRGFEVASIEQVASTVR